MTNVSRISQQDSSDPVTNETENIELDKKIPKKH